MPIVSLARADWGARPRNHTPRRIQLAQRPGVELHHSVGTYRARDAASWARSMQADHLARPGWADVWYSLGVWTDGSVIELRGVGFRSSPTDHLTVCLAGNYSQRVFSDAQQRTVQMIRRWAADRGSGLELSWHGARANVGCPGANVIAWAADAPNPPAPPSTQEDDDMTPEQDARLARVEQLLGQVAGGKIGNRNLDADLHKLRVSQRAIGAAAGAVVEYGGPDDGSAVIS